MESTSGDALGGTGRDLTSLYVRRGRGHFYALDKGTQRRAPLEKGNAMPASDSDLIMPPTVMADPPAVMASARFLELQKKAGQVLQVFNSFEPEINEGFGRLVAVVLEERLEAEYKRILDRHEPKSGKSPRGLH